MPAQTNRTCVIINPSAGSAESFQALRDQLESLDGDVRIVETAKQGDAEQAAAQVARERFDTIVAAGGDGTINEVVNGILGTAPSSRIVLGIVPLGTGNDLARTLNVPLDPLEAIETIRARRIRRLDVMKAKWTAGERFAINAAAGGFTGQVDEAMTDEIKSRWGPLAYLRGAIGVFPDLTQYKTNIRYDGKARLPVHALNIIVANGRTAGGGVLIAPNADPSDGLLDVVVVRTGTKLELAGVAARLVAGDYTNSDLVTHERATRVEVESKPGMWFNIDGELITNDPIVFTVVPQAIDVIVGNDD